MAEKRVLRSNLLLISSSDKPSNLCFLFLDAVLLNLGWSVYLMELFARTAIVVCSNYSGEDFYFLRGQIERSILNEGRAAFEKV